MMTRKQIKEQAARYLKFVEWNAEDGVFVGECPALFIGGVHGHEEAAVYKELCELVEEWIELLHKDGTPLPPSQDAKKYSGKFVVRVEPELHRRIAAKAQAEGESLNTYIERALVKA
jgi:predicted HicB family RNase H-like nuclease